MDARQVDEVKPSAIAAAAIAVLLAAAGVYFWKLGSAPLYLAPDEAIITNDAFSLARTGRTLDGTFLPLYVFVEVSRNWFMPAIYYLQAIFLQVLPLSEAAIRIPSVVVALVTMALAMAVARKAIGREMSILIAAIVLACAPAFFILSRYALDYTYPLPLILAWLYAVLTAFERPRAIGWFLVAGMCLGIGFYTYISSMVMMPVYAALTIGAMLIKKRSRVEIVAFAAAFAVLLTFFAVWAVQHPQAFQQTAQRYGLVESRQQATATGLVSTFDFIAMANRYRNFFGIEFLFKLGDVYLPFSTRTTGVFVPAAGVLLGIGIVVALVRRTLASTLILLGFLTAPLAASILVEEGAIRRSAAMLIFGALLAAIGAARLDSIERIPFFRPLAWLGAGLALFVGVGYLSYTITMQGRMSETATRVTVIGMAALAMALLAPRTKHGRLLLLANVMLIVIQFASVVRGYHGEYMSRLAPWLQGNIRGAVVELIETTKQYPGAPIYFTTLRNGGGYWELKNHFVPSYWQFYVSKLGRDDLASRAVFLLPDDSVDSIPKGSLVLGNNEDVNVQHMIDAGAKRISNIAEIDRPPFFTLLLK
jgi:4-amino-4-deoxy-L-arabinose transferase-like glycosyltransferase